MVKKDDKGAGISIPELDEAEKAYVPRGMWTEAHEAILKRYYGKVPTALLTKHLGGRSPETISRRANRLGLKA